MEKKTSDKMKLHVGYNNKRMTGLEKTVVLSIIFAPFTALRFSFFGFSELLLILLVIAMLLLCRFRLSLPENNLTRYYFALVIFAIFGWFNNVLRNLNSGNTASAIFNLTALTFTVIVMYTIEYLSAYRRGRFSPERILHYYFVNLSLIDLFLFIISRYRRTVFGLPLFYYSYFAPLADNIHQFAMMVVPLPFIGFYSAKNAKSRIKQLFYLSLSLFDIYISCDTGSFKAEMGIYMGCITLILLLLAYNEKISSKQRIILIIIVLTAVLIFMVINIDKVIIYAIGVFTENDGNGGREHLYNQAIRIIVKHPILGLGPSAHLIDSTGQYHDAHETILTAGLSGGIGGMVAMIILFWKVFRSLFSNPFYFSAMIPLYIYAAGGDILRKTAVWVVILLLYYADVPDKEIR